MGPKKKRGRTNNTKQKDHSSSRIPSFADSNSQQQQQQQQQQHPYIDKNLPTFHTENANSPHDK